MWNMETLRGDGTMVLIASYDRIISKLEKLLKRSDYEFMDYVYKMIKDLPVFNEVKPSLQNKKNNEKSLEFLKDNLKALEMYTRSIATAELDSEYLSIAYANRSAVLFENKYYKECLEDIERALKGKYPSNLVPKLLNRKQKAENLLSSQKIYSYHDTIPKIENKNPLIQSASDSIEIQTSEKWGWHIIAAKDIKAGEVIIVEKPYAQTVDNESKYIHCHECLELCYNMIPCKNCTEVLYCSETCRDEAYMTYHRIECTFFQLGLNEARLFLRVFLKGVTEYKKLKEGNCKKGIYRSDRYKEVYELLTHRCDKSAYDLYQDCLEPIVFHYYLKNNTDILEETDIEHKDHVLKELLLHHCLNVHCNATCIEKPKLKSLGNTDYEKVGKVIYAFHSLLNHSCNANSFPVSYGSHIVIRAQRNIKKGEQVTVNYGFSFNNCHKFERQFKLQKHYHFTCTCDACTNDWPTSEHLRQGKQIPQTFVEKVLKMYGQETVDKKVVNKLLNEAFNIVSSMKAKTP
ncbi:hypothetical protein NQ318_019054, partial [Aromia moschata]